ncbi:MAG: hypothetical protein ACR2N3_03160 [Pyrinomonadaceae bacterium]
MFQEEVCPECERALEGAIEVSSAEIGGLNIVVMRETTDRNWIECDGCGKMICKNCCLFPGGGYCNSCFFKYEIEPHLSVQSCR